MELSVKKLRYEKFKNINKEILRYCLRSGYFGNIYKVFTQVYLFYRTTVDLGKLTIKSCAQPLAQIV